MTTHNNRATWLLGPNFKCSRPPKFRDHPPRLILLGPPGVGRSTQAEMLCAGLGVCHLATADLFRAAKSQSAADHSAPMNVALKFLCHGAAVPETTVVELVRERRQCLACHGGFLLDGFPQTAAQAHALEELLLAEGLRLDAVLNYQLPLPVLLNRARDWQSCQVCHARFHRTEHPPHTADVCDHCGGILTTAEADLPETLAARWHEYEVRLTPLLAYYLERGLVRTISAAGPPQLIFERTLAILDY